MMLIPTGRGAAQHALLPPHNVSRLLIFLTAPRENHKTLFLVPHCKLPPTEFTFSYRFLSSVQACSLIEGTGTVFSNPPGGVMSRGKSNGSVRYPCPTLLRHTEFSTVHSQNALTLPCFTAVFASLLANRQCEPDERWHFHGNTSLGAPVIRV